MAATAAPAAGASAHPGHGHWISVGNGQFNPATKRVVVGTNVTWYWDWPDLNHSVTADPGQAESFDSDPGGTPDHPVFDIYSHRFTQVGTFTYHCRVHAGMTGAIEVVERPPPTPAPPSGPVSPPGPGNPLTLAEVRVNVRLRRVAFTVSYASTVRVRIDRRVRSARRVLRTFEVDATAGRNRIRIRPRVLAPGRYRVRLVARDGAGNRSDATFARFRVDG